MRRDRLARLACLAAIALVATFAARAEEIVHFTNGTTMAIRAHEVHEGMVHVDLGGNALMAFPIGQVERITAAGRDVLLPATYTPANVAAEGDSRSGVRVRSAGFQTGGVVFGRETSGGSSFGSRGRSADAPSAEELLGLAAAAASRPAGNGSVRVAPSHPNAGMRQMRANGRLDAFAGAGVQNGTVGSLGRTIGGEAKLMLPQVAGRAMSGVDVLRVLPSEAAAAAGVAEGKPLNSRPAAGTPTSSSGSGQ